jgi:hypothetical protein
MAKEIPYFKFYISEWLNGDITLETNECQGLFINACAYYWQKDGQLTLTVLLKRFRGFEDQINILIGSNLIKLIGENISISFLDEQMGSKEVQKITNRKNGSKGGRPKKVKTEIKPTGLFSETETKANDNPNITNIEESKVNKSKVKEIKEDNTLNFIEDIEFRDLFLRWVNYKKERKEKYKTDDSLKTAFEKLKKYSGGEILKATQIIENSIGMNYAGFFELKQSSMQITTQQENKGIQSALNTFDRLKR